LEEVEEVCKVGGVDRVLLDNMVKMESGKVDVSVLVAAMKIMKEKGKNIKTEASGNVSLATVGPIAATGVDFISSGGLTHSVEALDISFKIIIPPPSSK